MIVTLNSRRDNVSEQPTAGYGKELRGINSNVIAHVADISYGLEIEETNGLLIEDRKRRRSGPATESIMDTDDNILNLDSISRGNILLEAVLSGSDCATSPQNVLTKLAKQANQQP